MYLHRLFLSAFLFALVLCIVGNELQQDDGLNTVEHAKRATTAYKGYVSITKSSSDSILTPASVAKKGYAFGAVPLGTNGYVTWLEVDGSTNQATGIYNRYLQSTGSAGTATETRLIPARLSSLDTDMLSWIKLDSSRVDDSVSAIRALRGASENWAGTVKPKIGVVSGIEGMEFRVAVNTSVNLSNRIAATSDFTFMMKFYQTSCVSLRPLAETYYAHEGFNIWTRYVSGKCLFEFYTGGATYTSTEIVPLNQWNSIINY